MRGSFRTAQAVQGSLTFAFNSEQSKGVSLNTYVKKENIQPVKQMSYINISQCKWICLIMFLFYSDTSLKIFVEHCAQVQVFTFCRLNSQNHNTNQTTTEVCTSTFFHIHSINITHFKGNKIRTLDNC